MQKNGYDVDMRLVKQKHLLMNSKIKKKTRRQNKRKQGKLKELEDKNLNSTANQNTNYFKKITIKIDNVKHEKQLMLLIKMG